MKLKILHEAKSPSPKRSVSQSLLEDLREAKPDITLDDIAWFVAYEMGRSYSSASAKDIGGLFYDGLTGIQGNQALIDETIVESYIEFEENDEIAYKQLVHTIKDFFEVK